VDAVLSIAEKTSNGGFDCNLSRIKFEYKEGGSIENTTLYPDEVVLERACYSLAIESPIESQ
jgi:hypothetical protein